MKPALTISAHVGMAPDTSDALVLHVDVDGDVPVDAGDVGGVLEGALHLAQRTLARQITARGHADIGAGYDANGTPVTP